MACRWTPQPATALQSAYCPICRRRTQHSERVALTTIQVDQWSEVIGLTAAQLCCSTSCLAGYHVKLSAAMPKHPQLGVLLQLGQLALSVAETVEVT